ncbi:MAG: peptidoglycan editing factor PgeF [Rickettsiaceae bacterium]
MLNNLVLNKVDYKIFDKTHKQLTGIYAKYKISDPTKLPEIQKNLESIKSELDGKKILILEQIHSNHVVNVNSENITNYYNKEYQADASVTSSPGIILAIQTADCVPVLLSCASGQVIGAAHCGWRGAKANIIKNTIEMMKSKGSSDNIYAVIGPSIAQKSYEVDLEFYHGFIKDNIAYKQFFLSSSKSQNHYLFDIKAFVQYKLNQMNVTTIINNYVEHDTYSMPLRYYSYRRCCHTQEIYNGNILSTIMIK